MAIKRKNYTVLTFACCVAMFSVTNASAAEVTLLGDDVSFTFDDATLYGVGNVVGNAIFFSPTSFSNESIDGATVGNVNEVLNIDIRVLDGSSFTLDSVSTVESGDYILDGAGSSVSASLRTQVTSLTMTNGLFPMQSVSITQTGMITSPQDGTTNEWNLLDDNDWTWGNETAVQFQIQNNLLADTDAISEYAFIQKKFGAVGIEVRVVPLPAASWMFLSALVLLFVRSRRV